MNSRWIKHDSLTSTNSMLSDMQRQQATEEGVVLIADYQDGGRGLGDHAWLSRKGENLLMSLLLKPAFLSASEQFQLSMLTSLALCDVLDSRGISPLIKWPNDILVRGGKIAGILIEHGITAGKITHTIVGIGLNLNQTAFPAFAIPATSLFIETGNKADILELAGLVETGIMSRYRDLKQEKPGQLEKQYMDRLYLAGKPTVFRAGEELFEGTIRGISGFGELRIEHEGEIRTFGHGSVSPEHLPGRH